MTETPQPYGAQSEAVDDAMIDRAVLAGIATRPTEYPPRWPDSFNADEVAHGRAFMRAALESVLPATIPLAAVEALVEADKEYDAARNAVCKAAQTRGRHSSEAVSARHKLGNAIARRAAALARCADELQALTKGAAR